MVGGENENVIVNIETNNTMTDAPQECKSREREIKRLEDLIDNLEKQIVTFNVE